MAEVKVKITAANQTQTGFQSVLADAQKTATQVQQTFSQASAGPRMPKLKEMASAGPMDIDIGDYGLGPLRELQEELKRVRQSAQQAFDPDPPQQFNNGIGGVLGRFAIMIGVAATVGKVVASAFDQLSQAVKAATSVQEQFNQVLGEAGTAPSLDGAISGYKQLNSLADQTGKIIDDTIGKDTRSAFASFFSAKPGQLLNRGADFFGFNFVTSGLRSQEQDQRSKAQQALLASLERQKLDAQALSASAGDPSATERIQREQRQREQRRRLDDQLRGNESPQFIAEAKAKLEAAIAAENEAAATRDRLESEKQATREKEKQAREAQKSGTQKGNVIGKQLSPGSIEGIREFEREQEAARRALGAEFGPGTADAAAGGFRVDAAEFARQQAEEAAKALAAANTFGGAFGASALQRIGGSSEEFFRVRPDQQREQRRTNELLKQINEALRSGEPLVLKGSK
jgi:hypothetical protein